MSNNYSNSIRVNALAPGFFLTDQNRFLLIEQESGELTDRGRAIRNQTVMGRFGVPQDMIGAVLWMVSPSSDFLHGVVITVDGGFTAFGGV